MNSTHITRETFLANLRQSGLLAERELQSAIQRLPETSRGKVVARALVEWGLLTKFQAELLLAGRTNGFTLGQYRILDQIGTGGMGRVFRARHQTMNRIVAIKVLAPQFVKTERARMMFLREVEAAGRLQHPNIVTAYDANEVGGRHYLVMEYVDGLNLDQLVRERGPLPIGLACELIRQAAQGLQYAFEMGMVHRDIKPANLLVQRPTSQNPGLPCAVKILDFGLARLQSVDHLPSQAPHTILVRDNTVMGTPDFVSPEQARDIHAVDIRSDLYSLGCTFYYLLTGRVPFPGGSVMDKLMSQNAREPAPIEDLCPEAPPAVMAVLRRLMAKKPGERFQTPAEVAAALAPFARPGPAAAVPVPPVFLEGDADDLSADPGDWATDQTMSPTAEGAALVGTQMPDLSATPFSAENMSAPKGEGSAPAPRPWLIVAVLCALSAIAGLIGLIGYLLLDE